MCILAIESSCDESALAIFDPASGFKGEWIASQTALQERYGGVVPDLASREHLRALPLLLEAAMQHPAFSTVTAIAVTQGPGLAPALAMGISFAQTLVLAKALPLYGVNHLRGHAFSPFISLFEEDPAGFQKRLQGYLPHLGLLVSGGNTLLFELDAALRLTILAQTLDDAAGEALDKGARLLGLKYPGGPLVEQYALGGNPQAYAFPRALQQELAFSFSGLKTALRYTVEKLPAFISEKPTPSLSEKLPNKPSVTEPFPAYLPEGFPTSSSKVFAAPSSEKAPRCAAEAFPISSIETSSACTSERFSTSTSNKLPAFIPEKSLISTSETFSTPPPSASQGFSASPSEKLPPSLAEKHSLLADLCASYQAAVFDQLLAKTQTVLSARRGYFKSLGLSGGVANNKTLRSRFQALAQGQPLPLLLAQPKHSGDNAGMIAFAHYLDSSSRSLSDPLTPPFTAPPPSCHSRSLSLTAEPSLGLAAYGPD